jgi:hypothetical protein
VKGLNPNDKIEDLYIERPHCKAFNPKQGHSQNYSTALRPARPIPYDLCFTTWRDTVGKGQRAGGGGDGFVRSCPGHKELATH